MRMLNLGNCKITRDGRPYIIAEIGVNHEGSMDLAKELISLAKMGGANAAKFQTYTAEKLASRNSPAYWDLELEPTVSQFELFQKYDKFSYDEYAELAQYCTDVGIDFLSTPFDEEAVEFLAPMMPLFKIASADLTNTPLLRKVASYHKPVLLSTGASTLVEIDQALFTLQERDCDEIVLLHCILNYPTRNENAHLRMITGLLHAYPDYVVGYSDHTLPDAGMWPLMVAYLCGARVMEKHFTHDKMLSGNDHYHAMDVEDLKCFVERMDYVRTLLGEEELKQPISTETISRRNARRSIVLKVPVKCGAILDEAVLTCKRPGTGISPSCWDQVIGKRVIDDLDEDHVLKLSDIAQ